MLGVHNFPEDIVLHGEGAELSKVVGGGVAGYVGKAVRVGQVGVGEAYLFGEAVHLSQKYPD